MTRQTPSVWGFSSLLRNREWEQGRHCCQPLEGLGWAEKVAPGETPARVGAPLSTPRAWDPGTLSTEPESPRKVGRSQAEADTVPRPCSSTDTLLQAIRPQQPPPSGACSTGKSPAGRGGEPGCRELRMQTGRPRYLLPPEIPGMHAGLTSSHPKLQTNDDLISERR